MYSSLNETQSSYSKRTSYLLLFAVLAVLLLSLCELSYADFRAARILQALRTSENKSMMEGLLGRLVKSYRQIDEVMYDFKELLNKEQYLLTKLRDIHIQDSKEQSEIPEISSFAQKLNIFKEIYNENQEQLANFTRNVNHLKTIQKKNLENIAYSQEFKEQSEALLANMTEFQEKLREVVGINIKWSQRAEKQFKKDTETVETQTADNYVQDLPEYYSLPTLAQQILRPLPIQLLKTLYNSTSELHQESQLQMRQKFYKERDYLAKHQKGTRSFTLTKYNIQSGIQRRNWDSDILNDYNEMNNKYSLQSVASETGFCIVVPTYNNAKNFRAELNLNSIFSQNYTNYKVVIIDDASTDKTPVVIQKYLDYFSIPKEKCELIVNKQNKKALQNIYNAIINRCDGHQIVAIVDGDDELIGFNVLKVLNAVYSRQKLGVVYSNFYFYRHSAFQIKEGFNKQYTEQEKQNYRAVAQKFSHLITFKAQLLREVKIEDLQYTNGKFYHVAYDFAMMYPIMELSCGHVYYLDEFQYLYSIGTGLNDYEVLQKDQKQLGSAILRKTPYPCSYKYDY